MADLLVGHEWKSAKKGKDSRRCGRGDDAGEETMRARSDSGQGDVTSPGASRIRCIPPNGLKARTRTATLDFSDERMKQREG